MVLWLGSCAQGGEGGGFTGRDIDPAQTDAGRDGAVPDAGEPDAALPPPVDAGEDASLPEPDAGDLCAAVTSCTAPVMLGSISGDTEAQSLQFQGTGSAFLAVQVREEDGGVVRTPVEVAATLTSPAGRNFDLLLYAQQDGCLGVTDSSSTMFLDIVDASWGDEGLSNADDTRTVIFEVRHISGTCASDASWNLEVRGN